MRALSNLTNPEYHRPAAPSHLHRWLRRCVQNGSGVPFAYLLLRSRTQRLPR